MMSTETNRFPSGELRASDADRDLAIADLSEHFQTGRLTQDEFDERSARAPQARTGRELSELFADLPGGESPRGMADSAGLVRSRSCRRPVPFAIVGVGVGVVAVIAVASLLGVGQGGFGWLIPAFIVLVVVRRIAGHR
jgi:hypothetical protein